MKILSSIFLGYGLILAALIVLAVKISFPNHRLLAIALFIASLIPFVKSYILRRNVFLAQETYIKEAFAHYWPQILFLLAIILFVYAIWVVFPANKTLSKIPELELLPKLAADQEALIYLHTENQRLLQIFADEKYAAQNDTELLKNKDAIKELWQEFISNSIELDLLRGQYHGFSNIKFFKKPEIHSHSFLLAYGALISEYVNALKLSELVGENLTLQKILNDSNSVIPRNSFTTIQLKLTSHKELLRLNAGRIYLPIVSDSFTQKSKPVVDIIEQSLAIIDASLASLPKYIAKNPLAKLENNVFKAWFPLQKGVAEQISFIKVSTRDYLISPDLLSKHRSKLQPGDIMLQRREWHATNAGIPGYWTHAAMYTGSLKEMDEYFADLASLGGRKFSTYIKENYPELYNDYAQQLPEPKSVIEAKREGVILTSLEESAAGDSLSVLRVAGISKEEQFLVLKNAFRYWGYPYDYNFDFSTDTALVCSELVYKAYLGVDSLNLNLSELNGHLIYAPNSLAKKFDQEFDSQNPELKLVLFLDGSEKSRRVHMRDDSAFRSTWRRPKWHILRDYYSE